MVLVGRWPVSAVFAWRAKALGFRGWLSHPHGSRGRRNFLVQPTIGLWEPWKTFRGRSDYALIALAMEKLDRCEQRCLQKCDFLIRATVSPLLLVASVRVTATDIRIIRDYSSRQV